MGVMRVKLELAKTFNCTCLKCESVPSPEDVV
jgi:hypothetical protein